MEFSGTNSVQVNSTGNEKRRFTLIPTISADGRVLKSCIIFKGLKHVPKIKIPPKIEVFVSDGGNMNGAIMAEFISKVLPSRGPYFQNQPELLIMDSLASHTSEDAKTELKKMNVE